jgi:hypothetical protein
MSTEVENYDLETYDEENVLNNTRKKFGKRRYFPSNKPQTYIRNAVTGVKYPYMVGSYDQRRLFKIVDATGTCNEDGFILKTNQPNFNTNHLFYDSPEQCMVHMHISIQPEEINKWRERSSLFD